MKRLEQQGRRHKLLRKLLPCFAILLPTLSMSYSPPPLSAGDNASKSSTATQKMLSKPTPASTPSPYASRTRISLNFNNISTRQLLQVIAQFTGLNFVISDKVTGSMSIHLKNTPWNQALAVILKSQALGQRRVGEAILVAPIAELAKNDLQELKIKDQVAQLKPLKNRIIHLKYAKAEDIQKLLTSSGPLLTKRGQISIDNRTNSIWVRDTPAQLAQVIPLIRKLDFPVKQVLIEARIVRIERPFERELGVRLGVTTPNNLSGTLEGGNASASGTATSAIPIADRLNFNVPANAIFGATPGSIGLAVAKLSGATTLDLELSALEQEGRIELVRSFAL